MALNVGRFGKMKSGNHPKHSNPHPYDQLFQIL